MALLLPKLQQYLPFTVLKRDNYVQNQMTIYNVATVLTVYGIETRHYSFLVTSSTVATVLTVYGIETLH